MPSVPVIPITSLDGLPATLGTFVASLVNSKVSPSWSMDTARDLLPHCAVNAPLSRRSAEVTSTASMSFKDLINEMTTDGGQDRIAAVLGKDEAARLVSFWTHEFAIP